MCFFDGPVFVFDGGDDRRGADDGGVVEDAVTELQKTACARYDRVRLLVGEERPEGPQDGFAILQDPSVKLAITVQHMVMRASTGELDVRIP